MIIKTVLVSSLFFSALVSANESKVYQCIDGQRSFVVTKNSNGQLKGTFNDFPYLSPKKKIFKCEVSTKGSTHYKCTKDNYIVTIFTNVNHRNIVEFELSGDFWPDSGYLFGLNCQ